MSIEEEVRKLGFLAVQPELVKVCEHLMDALNSSLREDARDGGPIAATALTTVLARVIICGLGDAKARVAYAKDVGRVLLKMVQNQQLLDALQENK